VTIWILTLFPQIFERVFTQSIIKRAQDRKLVEIKIINIRDFATDRHKSVDDKPYGGGRGMVLRVDITIGALESIGPKPYTILLSAAGTKYNQRKALTLAKKKKVALICGHYEGVDARVEEFVDETISIGDFVLTGGEIAAMTIVDSVVRLIPGVIHPKSLKSESFSLGFPSSPTLSAAFEYPQYTRPEKFKGLKVPPVLLTGNHQKIAKWRKQQAIKRTRKWRPDLLFNIKNSLPRQAKRG